MVTEDQVDDEINILISYLEKTYGKEVLGYCGWHGDEGLLRLTIAARRFLLEKHEREPQENLTATDFERAKNKLESMVRKNCPILQHKTKDEFGREFVRKIPARPYQAKGTVPEKLTAKEEKELKGKRPKKEFLHDMHEKYVLSYKDRENKRKKEELVYELGQAIKTKDENKIHTARTNLFEFNKFLEDYKRNMELAKERQARKFKEDR